MVNITVSVKQGNGFVEVWKRPTGTLTWTKVDDVFSNQSKTISVGDEDIGLHQWRCDDFEKYCYKVAAVANEVCVTKQQLSDSGNFCDLGLFHASQLGSNTDNYINFYFIGNPPSAISKTVIIVAGAAVAIGAGVYLATRKKNGNKKK